MSKMTNVDNDLKLAVQRFIREYNNEVNYLKAELVKYRRKTERLEAKLKEKGETDEYEAETRRNKCDTEHCVYVDCLMKSECRLYQNTIKEEEEDSND